MVPRVPARRRHAGGDQGTARRERDPRSGTGPAPAAARGYPQSVRWCSGSADHPCYDARAGRTASEVPAVAWRFGRGAARRETPVSVLSATWYRYWARPARPETPNPNGSTFHVKHGGRATTGRAPVLV